MSRSFMVLGRQPGLGLAELESIYGAEVITPVNTVGALLDVAPQDINFQRLGGSMKLAKLLTVIDTTDWPKLEAYLVKHLPDHVCCIPDGKLILGLSVYNLSVPIKRVTATALTLKKVVRDTGRPCRIVPNKELALSSAQVLHNKLFSSHNWELLLISDGTKTYLAQTTNVQDIEAYAARDQKRPRRDAHVGMLPPKLAQIIINLATGQNLHRSSAHNPTSSTDKSPVPSPESLEGLLDPFCGTGVILQEAMLMGSNVIGSDFEERMVSYSQYNLQWIREKYGLKESSVTLVGDATSQVWPMPFYTIATETYLGRAFSADPKPEVLHKVIQDVDTIHKKFLRNVAKQVRPGFRMCLAVPAWKTRSGFKHLPTLDHLEELGYTRSVFVHAGNSQLIYHRDKQFVGRELLVLTRK